jgi:hypothetical protein
MDEKVNVPYVVHEADMARMERGNKRLSVLASILVALLFITNALWVWLWNQYEYVDSEITTTVSQDGEGNNIYGDGNEVNDGADSNNNGED